MKITLVTLLAITCVSAGTSQAYYFSWLPAGAPALYAYGELESDAEALLYAENESSDYGTAADAEALSGGQYAHATSAWGSIQLDAFRSESGQFYRAACLGRVWRDFTIVAENGENPNATVDFELQFEYGFDATTSAGVNPAYECTWRIGLGGQDENDPLHLFEYGSSSEEGPTHLSMLGSLEAGVTHRAWFSSTLDDRTAFQDDNTSSRGLSFLTWDEGTVLSGEVPEPSTIVLMSTLLLGSGALRLRKRGLGRGGPAR